MTRLTRDANMVWLLEFFGATDQGVFQQIWASEINIISTLLEKTEMQKLIIDLTGIKNFSSRDLQLLVILYKQFAQQNIPIVLRNPGPYLSRILRVMQLDGMFEIESDENHTEMK